MTHIETAIRDAVEKGGYIADGDYAQETWAGWAERNRILLDPIFWQALGKARGWWTTIDGPGYPETYWLKQWHRFVDWLADGRDAESFFAELLGSKKI